MPPPTFQSLSQFANSSNTIVAVWNQYANYKPGTFYVLQMSQAADGNYDVVYNGTQTQAAVRNLNMATTYYFKVAAGYTPSAGATAQGPLSTGTSYATAGNPSAPVMTLSKYGRDYLVVSWQAPNDGGCVLTEYRILYANTSAGPWNTLDVQPNATSLQYAETALPYHSLTIFTESNSLDCFPRLPTSSRFKQSTGSVPAPWSHSTLPPIQVLNSFQHRVSNTRYSALRRFCL